MNNRNWRGFIIWLALFGLLFFVYKSMTSVGHIESEISYAQFKRELHAGNIAKVSVGQDLIRGTMKEVEGNLCRRRGLRRSQRGAPGDHRIPERTGEVSKAGREDSEGRAALWRAGHRQDLIS